MSGVDEIVVVVSPKGGRITPTAGFFWTDFVALCGFPLGMPGAGDEAAGLTAGFDQIAFCRRLIADDINEVLFVVDERGTC